MYIFGILQIVSLSKMCFTQPQFRTYHKNTVNAQQRNDYCKKKSFIQKKIVQQKFVWMCWSNKNNWLTVEKEQDH